MLSNIWLLLLHSHIFKIFLTAFAPVYVFFHVACMPMKNALRTRHVCRSIIRMSVLDNRPTVFNQIWRDAFVCLLNSAVLVLFQNTLFLLFCKYHYFQCLRLTGSMLAFSYFFVYSLFKSENVFFLFLESITDTNVTDCLLQVFYGLSK